MVVVNLHNQPQLRASTVKCTTLDPYIGISESNSKPYTKFEFCKEKNCEHLRKHSSQNEVKVIITLVGLGL